MADTRDLRAALASRGFTPKRTDGAAIVALLVEDAGGDDDADDARARRDARSLWRDAERALVSLGDDAVAPLRDALETAEGGARARVVAAFGRVALALGSTAMLDRVAAMLDDPEPRARRAAARVLGKSGQARFVAGLAAALPTAEPPERKAIVEALGKLGAADALAEVDAGDDAVLASKLADAKRRSKRDVLRATEPTRIDAGAPLPFAIDAWLACKAGLAETLADECAELGLDVRDVQARHVVVRLPEGTPIGALRGPRCATEAALVAGPLRGTGTVEIAATLGGDATRALLRATTAGPLRYRLDWAHGHGRARTREVAALVAARAPELVDDPRESPWEAHVAEDALLLVPHALADARFDATPARVPASSHPSVAAALARIAGVRADDVVWDPFCGAGLELVEHARLGPCRARIGTDTDASAVAAARENALGAGAKLVLELADARRFAPPLAPTLLLTNPPLGHRTLRGDALWALLDDVIEHAARVMAPDARWIWLTPHAGGSADALERRGFEVEDGPDVDLGGVTARLQRARR